MFSSKTGAQKYYLHSSKTQTLPTIMVQPQINWLNVVLEIKPGSYIYRAIPITYNPHLNCKP